MIKLGVPRLAPLQLAYAWYEAHRVELQRASLKSLERRERPQIPRQIENSYRLQRRQYPEQGSLAS